MNNSVVHLGSVLNPLNNLPTNAFKTAEAKRYETLRRAPHDCGPIYADVNLNGETMKEILGYPA